MQDKVVRILHQNRIMGIATVRPDGWPQATLVGYAHEDLLIYFIVSRSGQKFANMQLDNRVSLVVGKDFHDPSTIEALSIAAHVSEVTDEKQADDALQMILDRHPGLKKLERPHPQRAAVMRAYPSVVTILDYSKGFGHADVLSVSPGGIEMTAARDDDWGFGADLKSLA